jgi:hypothetical protein
VSSTQKTLENTREVAQEETILLNHLLAGLDLELDSFRVFFFTPNLRANKSSMEMRDTETKIASGND